MEIRVIPVIKLHDGEDDYFMIYGCDVHKDDIDKVKINSHGNISIKGVMPRLELGAEYIASLREDTGSRYIGSYVVDSIKVKRPKTIDEQRTFLETILTKNQVNNIYQVYGEDEDVVGMIEKGEFDYEKVKGIGDYMFKKIQEKIKNNIEMSDVLTFLSKYNIKYNMIAKLVKEYGDPKIVIQKIEDNPYVLTEIKGIGFIRADEIAKAVGYSMTSPHRINSCLNYCVLEENKNGHSWMDYKQLLNRSIDLLNINKSYIEDVIKNGLKGIINVDGKFTTKSILEAEKHVALTMMKLKNKSKKIFEKEEIDTFLDNYSNENNIELEKNQRQFFHDWNENSIVMLVGGGGSGKSWLQRILLELIKKKDLSSSLLAPTGRASKVMQEYTGKEASTIHRRAGIYNEDSEGMVSIHEDVIIVDETSMCDIIIMSKLFKAIVKDDARILFVGDDFQLPSVGVGNFLHDVIHSNSIKVSRLTKIFRQEDDGIRSVSTDVRNNNRFFNDNSDGRMVIGKDCVFWFVDQAYIRDGVILNYKKVLKRFNEEDVVILTPTNKGILGTIQLNKAIQNIVNPESYLKKEKVFGKKEKTVFRVGDIVMNTVNTYELETINGGVADVLNGDTGRIIDIDEDEKVFIIKFDDIKIKMKFGTMLTNIVHAWVMTIHKSQGSQYDVVISITDRSSTYQLNANLMYVAWSRAKKYLLNLGQAETIGRAMGKFANMQRRSFLRDLLIDLNDDK